MAKKSPPDDRIDHEVAQIQELTEALQRERADAVNAQRRFEEQITRLKIYAKADVLQRLLPALDNLELALRHAPKDLQNHDYVKGVQNLAKQFDKALADLDIERIKTVGEVFNPHEHEAVLVNDGNGEREVVVEELQSGYKVAGEIIRPAMVKVEKQ